MSTTIDITQYIHPLKYFNSNNTGVGITNGYFFFGSNRKAVFEIDSDWKTAITGKKITKVNFKFTFDQKYYNTNQVIRLGASKSSNVNNVFPNNTYAGNALDIAQGTSVSLYPIGQVKTLSAEKVFQYALNNYSDSNWYLWLFDTHSFSSNLPRGKIKKVEVICEDNEQSTPQLLNIISNFECEFKRANASGTLTNDGEYVICSLLKITLASGAKKEDIDSTASTIEVPSFSPPYSKTFKSLLSDATGDGYKEPTMKGSIFEGKTFNINSKTDIIIKIISSNGAEIFSTTYTINPGNCIMNFSPDGSVAIGKFSNGTSDKHLFEVSNELESYFYGGIYGVTNYTSGEVATGGKWIDGKPIYRSVISITTENTSIADLNIESVVSMIGILNFKYNNAGSYWATNFAHLVATAANLPRDFYRIYIKDDTLISNLGTYLKRIQEHAILEYTKADPGSTPALPDGPEMFDDEIYVDEGIARADYIGMMAGIEIPADEANVDDTQADTSHIEAPSTGESLHFEAVKLYHKAKAWNAQMVRNAVGKWITKAEADEILKEENKKA